MHEFGSGELVFWLGSVAALIAVPVAIGALIVGLGLRLAGFRRDDSAKILRERLARGEITPAEFEAAQRALGH